MTTATALTTGQLPGGTSISVDNTNPVDGDELLIPLGDTTLDVTDTGTAVVGGGTVVKDTSIVYIIDVSGSTGETAGVDCNGDASNDTILVCEQVGAVAANTAAADPLSVIANSAVVSFSDPATLELGLTTDFSAVAATINGLIAAGFTN
ncbi:MAG: hypothetical protein OEV40_29595, partial [Acidimicrobiia bacterium]|nr:hypothetical protein [Acidimicrobiia bacterium]